MSGFTRNSASIQPVTGACLAIDRDHVRRRGSCPPPHEGDRRPSYFTQKSWPTDALPIDYLMCLFLSSAVLPYGNPERGSFPVPATNRIAAAATSQPRAAQCSAWLPRGRSCCCSRGLTRISAGLPRDNGIHAVVRLCGLELPTIGPTIHVVSAGCIRLLRSPQGHRCWQACASDCLFPSSISRRNTHHFACCRE